MGFSRDNHLYAIVSLRIVLWGSGLTGPALKVRL